MNDNLSDMVKGDKYKEDTPFIEEGLDLPKTESKIEEEIEQVQTIGTSNLTTWFEKNKHNFEDVKHVKLQVTGVDPAEDLVVTIPHESEETNEDGTIKRKLITLDNANMQPVLDLPGIDMKVYNNGFRIICQHEGNIFIKCYGIKTGLIATFCNKIADKLVPYAKTKMKKHETGIEVKKESPTNVLEKLSKDLDKEEIQILYRQSSKVITTLESNNDAVNWLLERQEAITDINHHIQIDDVIIRLLS
ncbi:MAG: hypothetical protein PVG65_00645 [Candidatus Thorarchaeota archaeon]|jgi:hypothetical protein